MSIKRSSKNTGTAARKPVSSPGVRHVEVTPTQKMAAGDLYSGWLCKNKSCGLLIAVAQPQPAGNATASDDALIVIKCPHCGDENLYRWSARGEHKYAVKNAGP